MLLKPNNPLTSNEVRISTLVFGLLAFALSFPLITMHPRHLFSTSWVVLNGASILFWGLLTALALKYFWESYYAYFYPAWVRRFSMLNLILYGTITLGMWILARRYPLNSVMLFLFLGGIEGVIEHLIGIYGLGILEKVPWLEGLDPFPILVFSFVEYVFYWSLVVWLALALQTIVQGLS